jgi:hypothetical protein
MTPRILVILSDLHVGSTCSLLQPDFVDDKKTPIGQNPVQAWFWKCWQDAQAWREKLVGDDEHYLVLNGDMVEGNHHRTTEIWSPDAANHVAACIEIVRPLADAAEKTFMVRGTECHVGGSENAIAHAIHAQVNPEFDQPYWDRLPIDMCGHRVSVRHHFPTTSRSYLEASQFSIQLGNAVNEAVRSGDIPPSILVGAHRHRTGHFVDGNRAVIVTGAWQALTRFGFKAVPDGVPCPSMYVLDWRGKEDGELPAIHFRRYNPPPMRSVRL